MAFVRQRGARVVGRPRGQRGAPPATCGAHGDVEACYGHAGQAEAETAAQDDGQAEGALRAEVLLTRLRLASLDHAELHHPRRHVRGLRASGFEVREVRLALRHVLALCPGVALIEPRAVEGDAPKHILKRGLRAQPCGQPSKPVAARAVRTMRARHAHDDVGIGREAGHVRAARWAHEAGYRTAS